MSVVLSKRRKRGISKRLAVQSSVGTNRYVLTVSFYDAERDEHFDVTGSPDDWRKLVMQVDDLLSS